MKRWVMYRTMRAEIKNDKKTFLSLIIPQPDPTVSLIAIAILSWSLFCFTRFWWTDRHHIGRWWSLPALTVGRPRGSIFKYYFSSLRLQKQKKEWLCCSKLCMFTIDIIFSFFFYRMCLSFALRFFKSYAISTTSSSTRTIIPWWPWLCLSSMINN